LGVTSSSSATGIRCSEKPSEAQRETTNAAAAATVHGTQVRGPRYTARLSAATNTVM
jgi:hypothetical protein